jgi:hypothetical protein
MVVDETSSGNSFFWLAFKKNSSGKCIIKKVLAFKPDQTFYTIERSIDAINDMDISTTLLYAVYDDSSLFVESMSLTNPLSTYTQATIPSGITEAPVGVITDGTDVWVLVPGAASGTNAKLVKYNTSLVFQETVDLTKSGNPVTNAVSLDVDSSGDIWVLTENSPAEYVRVYELSGGGYDFEVNTAS